MSGGGRDAQTDPFAFFAFARRASAAARLAFRARAARCSAVIVWGEANPNAGRDLEKTLRAKAEIVKAVTDAFAYCDPAYAALTDTSGAEVITITQENGRQQQQTRAGLLMLNVVHSNETYGSMVTTLRIKNISPQPNAVPPTR